MRVLVVEPEPFWQPELIRQFQSRGDLEDISSVAKPGDAVPHPQIDAVVIDLKVPPGESLHLLSRFRERERVFGTAGSRKIAIAHPKQSDWEWPLREFGLSAFVTVPIDGSRVAALCYSKTITTNA